MRRTRRSAKVGDYRAEYWPGSYNSATRSYSHEPTKPDYREYLVKQVVSEQEHDDPWYRAQGVMKKNWRLLTSEELLNAELTQKNSDSGSRGEQASELEHAGFHGPIGGGEARALKNLFTELGMPNLIKRGWTYNEIEVWKQPSRYAVRRAAWNNQPAPVATRGRANRLQYCYQFRSPMEGVPFDKFIRLARMYKDDSGKLKAAVRALLANPEAHKEIESLNALEILAGLEGMD